MGEYRRKGNRTCLWSPSVPPSLTALPPILHLQGHSHFVGPGVKGLSPDLQLMEHGRELIQGVPISGGRGHGRAHLAQFCIPLLSPLPPGRPPCSPQVLPATGALAEVIDVGKADKAVWAVIAG